MNKYRHAPGHTEIRHRPYIGDALTKVPFVLARCLILFRVSEQFLITGKRPSQQSMRYL